MKSTINFVNVSGSKWVEKTQKDLAALANEACNLAALQETGLVPKVVSCPLVGSHIYTSLIPNAVSLGDAISMVARYQITFEQFEGILIAILDALEKFWSQGWVHRDLHGNNILVTRNQRRYQAFLIDFEFSRKAEYATEWEHDRARLYDWILEELQFSFDFWPVEIAKYVDWLDSVKVTLQ